MSSSPCPSVPPCPPGPEAPRSTDASERWSEFVARYHSFLERATARALHCLGLPSHRDRIEDMTQETYCRLLEMERRDGPGVVEWREPPRVRAFLRRVAWSVVIDACRRNGAAKRGGAFRSTAPIAPDGTCVLDESPSADPDPESRLLSREELAWVRDRLGLVTAGRHAARNRRIVEMVVLEGRTAAEIVRRFAGGERPVSAAGLYSLMRRVRLRFAALGESGETAGRFQAAGG